MSGYMGAACATGNASVTTHEIVTNVVPKGISRALVDLNSGLVEAKKHMEILESEIALASTVDKLQGRSEV